VAHERAFCASSALPVFCTPSTCPDFCTACACCVAWTLFACCVDCAASALLAMAWSNFEAPVF